MSSPPKPNLSTEELLPQNQQKGGGVEICHLVPLKLIGGALVLEGRSPIGRRSLKEGPVQVSKQ